jgi:hypothetical protein
VTFQAGLCGMSEHQPGSIHITRYIKVLSTDQSLSKDTWLHSAFLGSDAHLAKRRVGCHWS